jgi:hypothetical protein
MELTESTTPRSPVDRPKTAPDCAFSLRRLFHGWLQIGKLSYELSLDLGLRVGILRVGKVLVRAFAQPVLMVLRTSLVLLLSLGVRGYGIH